jgi:spore coat polysaccharide biosynthesis predicted glycosyltransferase SpsG
LNIALKSKKILIAPLDWGLGHATRCITIIHYLEKMNCDITIAASGKTEALLKNEFPHLSYFNLSGYEIVYSKSKRLLPFKILIQIPKVLKIIKFEHQWLKKTLQQNHFDAVISDNRYGFFSKDCISVFITHQLKIKTGINAPGKILQQINYRYINHFTECWVPDAEGNINIAGELSHPESLPAIPVKYIGPLSRFKRNGNNKTAFKWMVIISGPEPQRSIFEQKIFEAASTTNENFLIVRGLPGEKETDFSYSNCTVFNHLNTTEMQQALQSSEFVISRCGYTTVMEILSMQKKSILIPTPGQTEQEYLAAHLSKQNWAYTFEQEEDFTLHFSKAGKYIYNLPDIDAQLHETILKNFVQSL